MEKIDNLLLSLLNKLIQVNGPIYIFEIFPDQITRKSIDKFIILIERYQAFISFHYDKDLYDTIIYPDIKVNTIILFNVAPAPTKICNSWL